MLVHTLRRRGAISCIKLTHKKLSPIKGNKKNNRNNLKALFPSQRKGK